MVRLGFFSRKRVGKKEQKVENQLPQSVEAEQSILGAVLLDNSKLFEVLEIVQPEDFYQENHRKIFLAFIELYEQNKPIDLVTVAEHLKRKNQLGEIGGATYLAGLTEAVPVTSHAAHYARIVKEKSLQRKAVLQAYELIGNLQSPNFSAMRGLIENRIEKISDLIAETETSYFSAAEADKAGAKEECFAHGVKIQAGSIFGIIGATSVGKTELALDIAHSFAAQSKDNVVVFAEYEGTKDELLVRLNRKNLKLPNVICAIKPDFLTYQELVHKNRDKNILIIVDYLQMFARKLQAEDKWRASDQLRKYVNQIFYFFDNLRNKYPKVCICLLSSLSKSGIFEISNQKRVDRMALLNAIKESGDIQYDLDYCYATTFSNDGSERHLGRFDNQTGKSRKYMHLIVAKNSRIGQELTDNTYIFNPDRWSYELLDTSEGWEVNAF